MLFVLLHICLTVLYLNDLDTRKGYILGMVSCVSYSASYVDVDLHHT